MIKKFIVNNKQEINTIREKIKNIYSEIEKIDIENQTIINKIRGEIQNV